MVSTGGLSSSTSALHLTGFICLQFHTLENNLQLRQLFCEKFRRQIGFILNSHDRAVPTRKLGRFVENKLHHHYHYSH